jgi:serine/threonine-protein kinase
MGRVYRAYDPMAKRVVAIKTLKTEYLTGTRGDEYRKRFRKEAQFAGNLAHPHVTTVFDVGDDFFVMELLEGVTLQRRLQQVGRLELAEVLLSHRHKGNGGRCCGPDAEAATDD